MIPIAKGSDVLVVPLSPLFNRRSLPLEGNAEEPIRERWFYGGDVNAIMIRPDLNREAPVREPKQSKPAELDVKLFFRGGMNT